MSFATYDVYIDAPPERVWQATIDVERWPEFIPTFRSVKRIDEGAFGLDKSARIAPKGFFASVWTVILFNAGRAFAWETRLPGLQLFAHHAVAPEGSGSCIVLRLISSGPVAILLAPAAWLIFRRNLHIEGDSMRAHCERAPA